MFEYLRMTWIEDKISRNEKKKSDLQRKYKLHTCANGDLCIYSSLIASHELSRVMTSLVFRARTACWNRTNSSLVSWRSSLSSRDCKKTISNAYRLY